MAHQSGGDFECRRRTVVGDEFRDHKSDHCKCGDYGRRPLAQCDFWGFAKHDSSLSVQTVLA